MFRNLALCIFCLLYATEQPLAMAQAHDSRLDKLVAETADLKHTVAEQDRRIAELEKTVKMLQAVVAPLPAPIPSPTAAWTQPSNWNKIKPGMSEAEVVQLLGPPTRVLSAIDVRTLYYEPGQHSTSTLAGSVTLTDDRVTASSPPAF